MTVGFYNYYNIQGRYTPDTVQDRYQQMVERYEDNQNSLHHYNENPYSEENLALRKLDEYLAPIASEIRSQYTTVDEVHQYLSRKYFGTDDFAFTKKWSEPEKYAMFENEYNAVLFGTIGSANRNDPRLEFDESQWEDYIEEEHRQSDEILKNQMQNILDNAGINLDDITALLFSFNPYDYSALVTGDLDENILDKINSLINSNNNSKELFFWAFQNSSSLDEYSVAKYRAYQEVLKYTGLNLGSLSQSNGTYLTPDNQDLFDILQEAIKNDSTISKEFRQSAFDYISGLLDKVLEKGYNNIEDLNLFATFSKYQGFSVLGKMFEA